MEVYAGEKSFKQFNNWLPDETVEAFRTYLVGIKGPLTTPVGGGIRSLNVALRQMLDLFVCLRPGALVQRRAVAGEASREGRHGDLPREHGRHLRRHRVRRRHAGGAEGARLLRARSSRRSSRRSASAPTRRRTAGRRSSKAIGAPKRDVGVEVGIGLKPISYLGTERLVHSAISYADRQQAEERHAGAQGQHHEVHRGRVPRLGLRGREDSSSARWRSTAARGAGFPRASRAPASSSRTRSPTSRCSRC